jgi:hypothetical protein
VTWIWELLATICPSSLSHSTWLSSKRRCKEELLTNLQPTQGEGCTLNHAHYWILLPRGLIVTRVLKAGWSPCVWVESMYSMYTCVRCVCECCAFEHSYC